MKHRQYIYQRKAIDEENMMTVLDNRYGRRYLSYSRYRSFLIDNEIVNTIKVYQGLDLVPRWRNGLDDGNWRWMWQSPKGPEFYPRWEMSEGKDWCLPLACRTSISNFTVQDPVTHTLTGAPTEGKRRAASAR